MPSLQTSELTPAWTPIVEANGGALSGPRLDYWQTLLNINKPGYPVRYVLAPCGRRSLKSLLPMRAAITYLPEPKEWDTPRYGFCGPTRDQAKGIAWDYFKALVPSGWVNRVYESDLCISTKFGSELWVVGLDRPQRVEGRFWDGLILTERPDIKDGALAAHILPALASRKGWLVEEGTPDYNGPSHNEYKRRVRAMQDREDARVFHWTSDTVLPPEEVQKLKEQMPEGLVRQELGGSFEEAPGRAYYAFTPEHIQSTEYKDTLPVCVSCDFNYTHHNWGLYQVDKVDGRNYFRAFDEVYEFEATVERMCKVTKEYLDKLGATKIKFYGDYSGEQRRAEATKAAWRQIRDAFPNAEFEYKKQPRISDRLEQVNRALRNANRVVSAQVDPKCKQLIRDLDEVSRKDVFGEGKDGDRTHASDNFGYLICQYSESLTAGDISRIANSL